MTIYDHNFSGYLGPGGWHKNGEYMNCTGGATGYIDRLILGNHVYRYPTISGIFDSQAFDPEGILGSINIINLKFTKYKQTIFIRMSNINSACHFGRSSRNYFNHLQKPFCTSNALDDMGCGQWPNCRGFMWIFKK